MRRFVQVEDLFKARSLLEPIPFTQPRRSRTELPVGLSLHQGLLDLVGELIDFPVEPVQFGVVDLGLGGPKGVLRMPRGIALDPKHKNMLVSDKRLNAVLTFNFPEMF